jgi:glycine/serine hydroxymethyltransferase
LTGEVGDTLALESVQEGAYFDDASEEAYQRLNERALRLRSAKVIFVAPHAGCVTAKLWYERLANQGVRVIELRPVSAIHGHRAAQSLARQIYLGLIFASTDRQCIDENFCKAVKELRPNDPVAQASPTPLLSPTPELLLVPPSP